MSNSVIIRPTKFKDLRDGSVTYGYCAYDNYGAFYSDEFESKPSDDDLDFFRQVAENRPTSSHDVPNAFIGMMDFALEQGDTIYVGVTALSFNEWKPIWTGEE